MTIWADSPKDQSYSAERKLILMYDVGQLASQKNARGQETTYEYYKNG